MVTQESRLLASTGSATHWSLLGISSADLPLQMSNPAEREIMAPCTMVQKPGLDRVHIRSTTLHESELVS